MHAAAGSFYDCLPVLEEFLGITDPSRYAPVPDDWLIAETDVQGSTEAINRGKYKDVNVAGAASIISLLNIDRTLGVPFIFGGDGATLCIPPAWEERAKSRLIGAVQMAREAFGLSLRAGEAIRPGLQRTPTSGNSVTYSGRCFRGLLPSGLSWRVTWRVSTGKAPSCTACMRRPLHY